MERYSRGRRGCPAKALVRVNRSAGSNPALSATTMSKDLFLAFLLCGKRGFMYGKDRLLCLSTTYIIVGIIFIELRVQPHVA